MISLIDAGPGTGKTFTIVYGYINLINRLYGTLELTEEQEDVFSYMKEVYSPKSSVCFFTHSKAAKKVLLNRLGTKAPDVHTFNGAGYSYLKKRYGYLKQDGGRSDRIIKEITGKHIYQLPSQEKWGWVATKKLCEYLKIECLAPTEVAKDYITHKYPDASSLKLPEDWRKKAREYFCLASRQDRTVEFVDMMWLASNQIKKPLYDLGIVDEGQDMSKLMYTLVAKMCKNVLVCGDSNQAIGAYMGASEEMYNFVARHSDAILPLKQSLRCPEMICFEANRLRPNGILHGLNPEEGSINEVSLTETLEMLRTEPKMNFDNTLIVSRTNSNVIDIALKLHQQNIPLQIQNSDLGTEIWKFVERMGANSISELEGKIHQYVSNSRRSKDGRWWEICKDKADSVLLLTSKCKSLEELSQKVKETFTMNKKGFKITTIHGSKGQEAEHVLIYRPPIELPRAMGHSISKEQEINLHFVALTRSSNSIYWVSP